MRRTWLLPTASLAAALFAAAPALAQVPAGQGTPSNPTYSGQGTGSPATMPMTSGTQAQGVPSVPPAGRGAPPTGSANPQAGGNLSAGGQIQPGTGQGGAGSGSAGGGPGGGGGGSGR